MINSPRTISLFGSLAVALLALAVVFAGIYVITERDHYCTGEGCHICLEIQVAQLLIEALWRLGGSMAVLVFFAIFSSAKQRICFFHPEKLVDLKVRFNC